MSNDTILYTVGEVAERFSLTVRTLRHWEAQGLLAPVARSWSNYRLYSPEDCARIQTIVIYRATGMKLMDIKSLLDSGDTAVEHLKRQRESLLAHRCEMDAMIEALDILLEDAMNDKALTVEEIGEILGEANFAAHQSEAEERYGDTDDWRESRERTASWQSADWRRNAERFHDIERRMIDAIRDGAAPDSERAAGSSRNIEKLSVSSSRLRPPSTTSCLARTSTTSVSVNTTIRSRLVSRSGSPMRSRRLRGSRASTSRVPPGCEHPRQGSRMSVTRSITGCLYLACQFRIVSATIFSCRNPA